MNKYIKLNWFERYWIDNRNKRDGFYFDEWIFIIGIISLKLKVDRMERYE